jgi:hypothetical protein
MKWRRTGDLVYVIIKRSVSVPATQGWPEDGAVLRDGTSLDAVRSDRRNL